MKKARERSSFEAIVTADQPIQFSTAGCKVKLLVWLHEKFDSQDALKAACAPLLEAVSGLQLVNDTNRAMMEREVVVFSPNSLRRAKVSLARDVETHLDKTAMIQ